MDYMTNHYRTRCEALTEQILFLEKKIKQINEDVNIAGTFGAGAPTGNDNDQLYALLQDLLKPENWNNPNYWSGYNSPGEFIGAILGKITAPPSAGTRPTRIRKRP